MPDPPTLTPAADTTVGAVSTPITATSNGAICTWGTSLAAATNASETNYEVAVGPNTLYYSCIAGSGDTQSPARTGSWSFTGQLVTPTSMQTMNKAYCDSLPLNGIDTLTDTRNDKSYKIIKLKMGPTNDIAKCWMQENLSIAGTTITPDDSNVASNLDIPAVVTTVPASTYYVTNPAYKPDNSCKNGAGQNIACSTAGYLYNWATAIAYSSAHYPNTNSAQDINYNAAYSICPKGWRLPIAGDNVDTNEFSLVDRHSYGGTGQNVESAAQRNKWEASGGFAVVYAGAIFSNGSTFSDQGSYAYVTSATANPADLTGSGINAFAARNTSENLLYPNAGTGKLHQFSLRCIFGD
jgi:uncharacterized protein (TIGR02145 family)